MNRTINHLVCTLALAVALAQTSHAAAATKPSTQSRLASAITDIRVETVRTSKQLQTSVDVLSALTKQTKGDLRPTYDAFVAQVKQAHAAADETAARAISMQAASKDYFGGWQNEIADIQNNSLRKKAQKRLDAARKSYDKVVTSLREASEKFKPFLSNLDDVQKTLANDITPGGVKSIRGTANDANWNMRKVNSSISQAIKELQGMEKSLSSHSNG